MNYLFAALLLFIILDMLRGYLPAKNKKNYLIKNITILMVVFVALFLFGPFFLLSPVKLGYSALKEDNLTLYYPGNRIDVANEIMRIAKEANRTNESFYRRPIQEKVLVVFSDFDMLRFGAPPGAGGAGTPFGINVKAGRATLPVLTHEMSHRNLPKIVGTTKSNLSFPRWFDEGLASYLGKMDYYKTLNDLQVDLKEGRYKKDITKWRGLPGMFQWQYLVLWSRDRNPKLLYGQVYQMTKYLFEKYGEEKVYQAVIKTKAMKFEDAFKETFGVSEEDFHNEFINYLYNFSQTPKSTNL